MQYIVAVGAELHFTRAAERVHVAQPSLSKQIRKVEAELGVELFKRGRRKPAEITEAGRAFIENAQQALLYAHRAASMARAANAGDQGKLCLGVSPCVDLDLFLRLRDGFETRHGGVRLQFVTGFASEHVESVLSSDLHAGLIELPMRCRSLAILHVFREPVVLAVPNNDRLALAGDVTPEQLKGRPLVLPSGMADVAHEKILRSLHEWGYRPEKIIDVHCISQALGFVAASEAVAVVPGSARGLKSDNVVVKSIPGVSAVEIGIAYRPDLRNPLVRNLIHAARDVFAGERSRMI